MEIKRKVKGMILGVSIDALPFSDIQGDQREGEGDVTRNIIDEFQSQYILGDEKEGERSVT